MDTNRKPLRQGSTARTTRETEIQVELTLDGVGRAEIHTGIGFLDHMWGHVAVHGLMDLRIHAQGDLHVDEHHTAEDVSICVGQALDRALGERSGITRIAHAYVPMDEALALVAIDLSGRPYAVVQADYSTPAIGGLSTDLLAHLLETLAVHARLTLHAQVLYGRNDHHKAEALFKALGRALREAARLDAERAGVPSTKGVL